MRLVYTGDTISNFGEFVPAPYIEKVVIHDDIIDTTVAVFLSSDSYEEFINVDNLEGLYIYVVYLPGPFTGLTVDQLEEAVIANKLPDGNVIFDYFVTTSYSDLLPQRQNYAKIPIDEMEDTGEIIYAADGTPIRKLTYTFDEPWAITDPDEVDISSYGVHFFRDSVYSQDLYVFAFASFLNYDAVYGEEESGLTVGAYGLLPEHMLEAYASDAKDLSHADTLTGIANDTLVNAATGDLSYELIFKGGKFQTTPQIQYLMPDGNVFDGVPLQDITYNYRAPSTMTHLQIVKTFKRLGGDYYRRAGEEALTNALDQLSYILQMYADRPQLVLKLKELQTYFPEKVEGVAGDLYQRYSNMLAGVLREIDIDPILQKVLLRNAKLIDRRDPIVINPYESPEEHAYAIEAEAADKINGLDVKGPMRIAARLERDYLKGGYGEPHPYLYAGGNADEHGWRIGREMYPVVRFHTSGLVHGDDESSRRVFRETESQGTAEEGTASDRNPRNVRNFGYFFCDLEKIIHTDTLLSNIFNVQRVESLFGGKALTNLNVDITQVELKRGVFELSEDDLFGSNGYRIFTTMTLFNQGHFSTTQSELTDITHIEDDYDAIVDTDAPPPLIPYTTLNLTTNLQDFLEDNAREVSTWPAPLLIEHEVNPNFPELALTVDNSYNQGLAVGSEIAGAVTETEREGPNNFSYIIPRNFDIVNTVGLGTYRLLGYEFQDFYSADYGLGGQTGAANGSWGTDGEDTDVLTIADIAEDAAGDVTGGGASGEFYIFKTKIKDRTLRITTALTESYQAAQEAFQDYLELAEEHCSYNNVDGNFNAFFSTGMKEAYGENNPETPWVRAPVIYNLHRDLLFNQFDGDKEEMIEDARQIVDKINPETGRLEDVQQFKYDIDKLFNDFYGASGAVAEVIQDEWGVTADQYAAWLDAGFSWPTFEREYTTRGDQFPPIFYNYPEGTPGVTIDYPELDLMSWAASWAIMEDWYGSHGVDKYKGHVQGQHGLGGAHNLSIPATAMFNANGTFHDPDGWTGQAALDRINNQSNGDPEFFKNLWFTLVDGLINEILGWGTGTSIWDNHKKAIRYGDVEILWWAGTDVNWSYKRTTKGSGNKSTGREKKATRRNNGEDMDVEWDPQEYNVPSGKLRWVSAKESSRTQKTKGVYDAFYSMHFNLRDSTNTQGRTICNPMGYMIKKMFDWAESYEYKDYCKMINAKFLWTTADGNSDAEERNSQSNDAVKYALTKGVSGAFKQTGDKGQHQDLDGPSQYTDVLEEWANQIVRGGMHYESTVDRQTGEGGTMQGGSNGWRYREVILLARLIYAQSGKSPAPYNNEEHARMNSDDMLSWWRGYGAVGPGGGAGYAISWTTIDPRKHWLVFDPTNDRERQIYSRGHSIGKKGYGGH
jgi:hypothetical protein